MSKSRLFVALALTIVSLAPLTTAVEGAPPQQIVNLPPVNLAFDAIINPLGQFGLTSAESRSIRADHDLARQEVALALAYLSANKQRIMSGNDSIYNSIFHGFYDTKNPNYAKGYIVDDSHYMRVLHTFGQIQKLLNQPTFYSSGLNRLNPGAGLDAIQPKFINLDRGLRQWGMSNSASQAVYDAYNPVAYNNIVGQVGTIYPTGGSAPGGTGSAPGGLGSGQMVRWDRDTGSVQQDPPNTTYFLGNFFGQQVPDAIGPNPNPQFKTFIQLFTANVNGNVPLATPLDVYEHSNRLFSQTVNNAFYHDKLDIYGAAGNPNLVTLGDVFFKNTQANRDANAPIERIGDVTAALQTLNLKGLQTLPWNSGNAPGYTAPNVPLNPSSFFRASDWQVPELQRYQMIIASFAEFTSNPLDPRGGAFFGIDALVKATDPGVTELIAGAFDAGAFGQFVQALNDGGFSDPRNFPPVGKNGSFQPAIPGG